MLTMRIIRLAASALDLFVLALVAAAMVANLTQPDLSDVLRWENLSLVLLLAAVRSALVCLRPWTLLRRRLPAPVVPMVAVMLNIGFALRFVLTIIRVGNGPSDPLLTRVLLQLALVVGLNLLALEFRFPSRVPRWLWPTAALPTVAWAALFGWPLFFAGAFFGVRPSG